MSKKAPILFDSDIGVNAPIYKWEITPGTKNFINIWIKDPKKSRFSKAVKIEKPIETRHIKKMTPMDTNLPGVPEEIWFIYRGDETGLMKNQLYIELKEQLNDQVKLIKSLRQQITTLENQQKGFTSGAAKAVATMKESLGKNEPRNPSFVPGFGINRFNNGGF